MAVENDEDCQMRWWKSQIKATTPDRRHKIKILLARELWHRWMRTLSNDEIKWLLSLIGDLEE